jgi:hypothetical protein
VLPMWQRRTNTQFTRTTRKARRAHISHQLW